MKKILAIAIALVMVFAIASTALAGIGFPDAAAPVSGGKIDVVGLTGTAGVFRTSAQTYLKYDQTKGVVAGTPVTFLVTFTAARYSTTGLFSSTNIDIKATNMADSNGAAANISYYTVENGAMNGLASVTNTTDLFDATNDFDALPAQFDTDLSARVTFDDGTSIDVAGLAASAQTLYILFTGYEIDETKDATVTARWLANDSFYGFTTPVNGVSTLTVTKGGSDYTITKVLSSAGAQVAPLMAPHNNYDVAYNVTLPNGAVVSFDGIAKDAINLNYTPADVYVNMTGVRSFNLIANKEYKVARNITGEIAFTDLTNLTGLNTINPGDVAYSGLKSALDTALALYGWNYDIYNGTLNNAGFEKLAGSASTQVAKWTYYAYTTALTVGGTTAVPDTGDMSVVGIALVVVAVIAAAAVAIKKVRA